MNRTLRMSLETYCFRCDKSVKARTILGFDQILASVHSDEDVEVMHISDHGDHRWKLSAAEKEHLIDRIVKQSSSHIQ